jgi:hypothetical protein
VVTMPPEPLEYQGQAAIAEFFQTRTRSRTWVARLVPTHANNQPAFSYYRADPHAPVAHAHSLIVLTLAGDKICAITRFGDNSLFPPLRAAPDPAALAGYLPGHNVRFTRLAGAVHFRLLGLRGDLRERAAAFGAANAVAGPPGTRSATSKATEAGKRIPACPATGAYRPA